LDDRLRNERLENEKKELLHELQSLRRKVNPAAGGPSDVVSLCLWCTNNELCIVCRLLQVVIERSF